jgi:CspA family cold shock protein
MSNITEPETVTGRVKSFSERGFGFLTTDDGRDIFVHYSAIQGKAVRTLAKDERVEFQIIPDGKGGVKASNVRVI